MLLVGAIIAGLIWFLSFSQACPGSYLIRPSLLPDPPKDHFKLVAKVEIVELLKPLMPSGYGDRSFYAKAKVTKAVSGVSIDQVIQISIEASSCDVPVALGQTGYVASNKVAIVGDLVSADITAPPR